MKERLARAMCRARANEHNSEHVDPQIPDIDQFVENFWPLHKEDVDAVLRELIEMDWPLNEDPNSMIYMKDMQTEQEAKALLKKILEET